MKKLLFLWLILLPFYVYANSPVLLQVPPDQVIRIGTQASCLTSKITLVSSSNWYAQANFTVKNNCTSPQKLNNAVVSFQSNSNNISPMWGGVNSSSAFSYAGNIASTVLNIVSDPLLIGQTLQLSFGINLTGNPFDLTSANNTLKVTASGTTPANGVIDVKVDPTGVIGVSGTSEIDITGPGLSQPYVILNSSWNAPTLFKVTGLAYGTYAIEAKPIDGLYTGVATPASVNVNSSTPVLSTITYKPLPATGALQLSLGNAPLPNIPATVNATITDNTDARSQTVNVAWNSFTLVPQLPVGHNYKITFPQVTNGLAFSNPNTIPNPIILQNRTTPLTVTYQQPQPMPSQSVAFTVTGLPSTVKGTLNIVDNFGNKFEKTGFGNGTITQALPVNDTFAVSASATSMFATITPQSFTLKNGTPPPSVSVVFTANPQPTASANFFAYADTGMQTNNNGLVPPKGANMVEAFILYNPFTNRSDLWAITQGDPISQIIQKTPNTFASVGGANGPYPWDYQTVSQAVTQIEQLVDYYHFVGIDFDVEGSALETPTVQNWVTQAVVQLRKDRPSLIITLTVPDPVIGFTTGTVVILNQTMKANNNKMVFNWVNKMAFDMNGLGNGCTQTDTNMNNNCLVISATTAAQQMAILLGISQQEAYKYIGSIFMIPVDDQGHPLSLSLATQVATTLKNKGVTHMGYWRLQNDANLTYGNMFTKILGLS